MKYYKIFLLFLLLFSSILINESYSFVLESKDWKDGKIITDKSLEMNAFGCEGLNRVPEFYWRDVPAGTKSFALTVYDPDAPTGSGFWHWIVYDIPINQNKLNASSLSLAKQALNDYGQQNFGGFCPPKGTKHRYIATIYALNVENIDIKQDIPAMVRFFIIKNTIEKRTILSYYFR